MTGIAQDHLRAAIGKGTYRYSGHPSGMRRMHGSTRTPRARKALV